MVSESIFNYAENCVNQFLDQNSSVESIYKTKISHEYEVGSGVVIKIEDGPLNTGKRASSEESSVEFVVSDGTYAISCMAHNGTMLNDMTNPQLTDTLMLLTDSMRSGEQITICGGYDMHNKEKVFVVNDVRRSTNSKSSQLTDDQFDGYLKI